MAYDPSTLARLSADSRPELEPQTARTSDSDEPTSVSEAPPAQRQPAFAAAERESEPPPPPAYVPEMPRHLASITDSFPAVLLPPEGIADPAPPTAMTATTRSAGVGSEEPPLATALPRAIAASVAVLSTDREGLLERLRGRARSLPAEHMADVLRAGRDRRTASMHSSE
jgi:hypothetical protein